MTWDVLFKIIQTVTAAVLVYMIQDYIRFRIDLARNMVTRNDCDDCKKRGGDVDHELFDKIDHLTDAVSEVKNDVGNIQTDLTWIKKTLTET